MSKQLSFDFSAKPIVSGKKRQRLAIPCSDEFLTMLDTLSSMMGVSRAELAFGFVLEGMQKSLGNAFMAEPHLDKKLRDVLGPNGS